MGMKIGSTNETTDPEQSGDNRAADAKEKSVKPLLLIRPDVTSVVFTSAWPSSSDTS